MGADFCGYIPAENMDVGMAYSAVHRYRAYLMEMLGYGEEFRLAELGIRHSDDKDAEERFDELMDELKRRWEETDDDVYLGVREFCNHSDCDGAFLGESVGYIAKALDKLLETDIVRDSFDRERLVKLTKLFEYVYSMDGIVNIW